MKWFDKWFAAKCRNAWESASDNTYDNATPTTKHKHPHFSQGGQSNRVMTEDEDIISHSECYTLKMQPANGGTIISILHYNESKREWIKDLYIASESNDLGEEIKSILVQYRLKHN